jgi:hypothetical protein
MKVSKITIGRLFNLGNYEHVRYEVSVDVPEGDSAKDALVGLKRAIESLNPKPPHDSWAIQRAREILAKPASALPQHEISEIERHKRVISEFEAWQTAQKKSLDYFDDIGGAAKFTDAKENWNDDV